MKNLQKIVAILIIFAQLCLAFLPGSEPVFCVKINGSYAIESSVNGKCEDSNKLPYHKSHEHFLQSTRLPSGEICRDISFRQTDFYPDTKKNLYNFKLPFSELNSFLISVVSRSSLTRSMRPDEYSAYSIIYDLNYRRTIVLLI